MPPVLVCYGCEQRLTDVSTAIRRHASQMSRSIQMVRNGLSEEQEKNLKGPLMTSFNEAESLWESYRRHLIEHGILPDPRNRPKSH
jgi:hypothetical protein